MKQKLFTLVLFLFAGFSMQAQDKILTIDEAIIGQWRQLYPAYVRQLQWQGTTENYSWVADNTLNTNNINNREIAFISLNELNTILQAANIAECSYFPYHKWHDNQSIRFNHENKILIINLTEKKITLNIEIDKNAENTDFCEENLYAAFTIDNNLFVVDSNSKQTQITNEAEGIVCGQTVSRNEFGIEGGIFWSPKGSLLAFYRKDETKVTNYPLVDITSPIAEVNYIKYPMAGTESEKISLGIYNIATGKTIFIERDDNSEKYLTNITWSPDEKYIYIQMLNREQNHLKLNKYDATTGTLIKTLFEEKHEKYVEPENPLTFLTKTPNQFIYQSERDGYNHLYLYDDSGNLLKQLTTGKWIVTSIVGFDSKEANIFVMTTEAGALESNLYKVNLKTAKIERITTVAGTHEIEMNAANGYFIDTYSNTETPRIIQIIDDKGKEKKQILKAENPLTEYNMPQMEIITITAADGKTPLYASLIKPINFDATKKYPAIIYVYGGPHLQLVNNTWLGGIQMWQYYMAQKGYVMLTIDNRGSANRGLEFENVIHRQAGVEEMKDQMKGVEFLKNTGYVDMERIGVHGWSYGGFMTTSLMLNHADVFKVGVAGGPVIDWKFYEVMYGERYMDTPQENPEGYQATSLLDKADKLEGKLLLIHGCIDNTVVWQNSLSFIQACIEAKKQYDYVVYPLHEHNVSGFDRVHLMEKVTQYFDENL